VDGINPPFFDDENGGRKSWFSSVFRFIQRRTKTVNVTAAYSVAADVFWVRCDATAGAITVTLPASLDWQGRQIGVIKTDASVNAVTVSRAGSDLINGSSTKSLASQYSKTVVISDGTTNWDVIV
jgi:hypothetical protein